MCTKRCVFYTYILIVYTQQKKHRFVATTQLQRQLHLVTDSSTAIGISEAAHVWQNNYLLTFDKMLIALDHFMTKLMQLRLQCSCVITIIWFLLCLQKVARGGIRVSAVFNYKLTPELSTTACLINRIRVKNCIGIYHQWTNNKIVLNVWYQIRKVKKCKKWIVSYI